MKSLLLCLLSLTVLKGNILPEYHTLETDYTKKVSLNYYLYLPPDYHPRNGYPLLLVLTGEAFTSNPEKIREMGPPAMVEAGMSYNYFIVAPVLPDSGLWDPHALMALIREIALNYHLDPNHYWVTGYGDRGGWGTWELGLLNPGVFEKIAVLSSPAGTQIWGVHESSIRIYHGRQDTLVPIEDAENMYYELNWDNTDVDLIVFENMGHEIGDTVYQDLAFYTWLSGTAPQMGAGKPVPQSFTFSKTITRSFEEDYILYLPENYHRVVYDWPMMIFLHGAGNAIWNIEEIREAEPPKFFEQEIYSDYILLCPQLHDDVHWDVDRLDAITRRILDYYRVDEKRLYITGLSRGGFGAWEYAVTFPNRFAAVVPISARDVAGVERLANTNVWIFHGDLDTGVPWQGARFMYNRLRNAGGNVEFTLYNNVGHWAWGLAYNTDALWSWIFSQVNEHVSRVHEHSTPETFVIQANYPNPFNGQTTIHYSIQQPGSAVLNIYDINGRFLEQLINAWHTPGHYTTVFSSSKHASGIYIYQLSSGNMHAAGKMTILK